MLNGAETSEYTVTEQEKLSLPKQYYIEINTASPYLNTEFDAKLQETQVLAKLFDVFSHLTNQFFKKNLIPKELKENIGELDMDKLKKAQENVSKIFLVHDMLGDLSKLVGKDAKVSQIFSNGLESFKKSDRSYQLLEHELGVPEGSYVTQQLPKENDGKEVLDYIVNEANAYIKGGSQVKRQLRRWNQLIKVWHAEVLKSPEQEAGFREFGKRILIDRAELLVGNEIPDGESLDGTEKRELTIVSEDQYLDFLREFLSQHHDLSNEVTPLNNIELLVGRIKKAGYIFSAGDLPRLNNYLSKIYMTHLIVCQFLETSGQVLLKEFPGERLPIEEINSQSVAWLEKKIKSLRLEYLNDPKVPDNIKKLRAVIPLGIYRRILSNIAQNLGRMFDIRRISYPDRDKVEPRQVCISYQRAKRRYNPFTKQIEHGNFLIVNFEDNAAGINSEGQRMIINSGTFIPGIPTSEINGKKVGQGIGMASLSEIFYRSCGGILRLNYPDPTVDKFNNNWHGSRTQLILKLE